MRVVILEDEKSATANLLYHLGEIDQSIAVVAVIDTVTQAIDFFKKSPEIDMAFFDIHLADGNSFDVFKEVKINTPIVFTTAYDEYALKAFKVNSIDYLLKPIDEDELKATVQKFKSLNRSIGMPQGYESVFELLRKASRKYKSTFLVQQRDRLIPIDVIDIAYISIHTGVVKAFTFENKSYVINEKLEDIEASIDPENFFRANRQFIIHRKSIQSLTVYFNGKLLLNIQPCPTEHIVVSKTKAPQIKNWLHRQA